MELIVLLVALLLLMLATHLAGVDSRASRGWADAEFTPFLDVAADEARQ